MPPRHHAPARTGAARPRAACPHAVVATLALAATLASGALLLAQDEEITFVISVFDSNGRPVRDLKRDEIVLTENGVAGEVLKVQPFIMPVELTVAVDNGPLSGDALAHYRTGLAGLIRALPSDVEVTFITMSPQPLMVVQPTSDRVRLLRGINEFAPQEESPRFTDTLVEFARRYEAELRKTNNIDSVPVLLMVSTTVTEAVSYAPEEITKALGFLERRRAKVHVAMLNVRRSDVRPHRDRRGTADDDRDSGHESNEGTLRDARELEPAGDAPPRDGNRDRRDAPQAGQSTARHRPAPARTSRPAAESTDRPHAQGDDRVSLARRAALS